MCTILKTLKLKTDKASWWLVVESPPAGAGGTGLTPGLGRSHVPWSNSVAPPPLSLCSGALEPQLLTHALELLSLSALEPARQPGEASAVRSPCS